MSAAEERLAGDVDRMIDHLDSTGETTATYTEHEHEVARRNGVNPGELHRLPYIAQLTEDDLQAGVERFTEDDE